MSDVDVDNPTLGEGPGAPIPFAPPEPRGPWWRPNRSRLPHTRNGDGRYRGGTGQQGRRRPRVRKLRLLLILSGLGALAFISTVFGMMMAVASDLPQIENITQYKKTANSYLYDDQGKPIGEFSAPDHEVIDGWPQISQGMIHAVVAIEDRRFWTDPGVDIRGIGRAFLADVTGGATQGASTIAEQFVKNVLSQENNRTILEKLREAALAFQLTRKWPRKRIITQYLNTIYFGNGAYGIESAARVYFGKAHGYNANAGPDQPLGACGDATLPGQTRPSCASVLKPWESALLAGMIANPTEFDPFLHPKAAMDRRNLVLKLMYQQGYLTRAKYDKAIGQPLPTSADLQQPSEPPAAPYFTSWLRPQIISAVERIYHVPPKIAEYRAYYGGLHIKTTLDLQLQQAAQHAVDAEFPPGSNGPTAAIVSIDNHTGEVRAMVSGGSGSWNQSQFNLATQGHRQPGSAFKVFTLAEALRTGEYGPSSVIDSAPQDFIVPNSGGKEHFIVHNFGNTYSGPITLQGATDISDNTVYSQVGIHVGTLRIARLATQMGIRSYISHNYAMILGGLKVGVSPLDMAHAYETLATGGLKVYNPLLGDLQAHRGNPEEQAGAGPTGIRSITCTTSACGHIGQTITDQPTYKRVLPAWVATTEHSMLEGVVGPGGTASLAAIPGVVVAGKTGTTSNYGDAWFVGWTPQMTTAVWVGYPNKLVSMSTAYNGGPVEGGTFPAIIWNNFMTSALQILANEQAAKASGNSASTSTTPATSGAPSGAGGNPTGTATGANPTPATGTGNGTNAGNGGGGATGGATGGGTGAGTGGGTGAGTGGGTGAGTGGGTGAGTGGGTGGGAGGGTGAGTGGGGGGSGGGTSSGGSGGAGLGGGASGTG